ARAEQDRLKDLEAQLATAQADQARTSDLETQLATAQAEQARTAGLEGELEAAEADRAHLAELEGELAALQTELAGHPPPSETSEAGESAPGNDGPRWSASAQHALSAGFVGMKEWRAALKHAINTLGAEGGWDAAIAWSAERPSPTMRC